MAKGVVLGYAMPYKTNNDRVEAMFDKRKLSDEYVQVASRTYDTEANAYRCDVVTLSSRSYQRSS